MNLIGEDLLPHHQRALEARWIDSETSHLAYLRSVNSIDGASALGRSDGGDYSGIAIPNIEPGAQFVRDYRLRLDHPPIENGKPKGKYLAPPGRANLLYCPPGTDPAWLTDVSMALWVTEGEFKALSLFRLARWGLGDAAERPRAMACALPGVWCFRGTIGKTTDESGSRVDEKGVIPDLAKIAWESREVTIIFDANVETNDSVKAARKEFTRVLQERGALVRWFAW